jgi:phage terminase large subunit-like protein
MSTRESSVLLQAVGRVRKGETGRTLDGMVYDEFPTIEPNDPRIKYAEGLIEQFENRIACVIDRI